MAENNSKMNIDPRYMKYNMKEVEEILDKMASSSLASETDVRAIVIGSHSEP